MALTIQSNIASLQSQRRLSQTSARLSSSFERLSSGLRINKASDDAAGLAIADSLRVDSRVMSQGLRNVNDGISMLTIAEGSLTSLSNILTRITELAEQSANGVNSSPQRAALDSEAQALKSEYNRIISTTTFNGGHLFDGNDRILQVGINGASASQISVDLDVVTTVSGDGTFQAEIGVGNVNRSNYLIGADFNGDGNQDVGYASELDNFGVLLGNGNGTFKAPTQYPIGGNTAYYLEATVGDVNGDQQLDFVIGVDYSNAVSVLLGNGDGTFKAAALQSQVTGGLSGAIELQDFNGDGQLDIMGGDYGGGTLVFMQGNGNGTFKHGVSFAKAWGSFASGDLNGDDIPDLFVGGNTQIAIGNGNGTFSIGPSVSLNADRGAVLADINNDGNLDALAWHPSDFINYSLGNGNGTFSASQSIGTGGTDFYDYSLSVVDMNGDGNADLIVAETDDSAMGIYLGNGDGSFKARTSYATANGSFQATVADFNEDGALDIIAGNGLNAPLGLLLGNANASSTLGALNLRTIAGSREALDDMKNALANLSFVIGRIGAAQSRLHVAGNYLRIAREGVVAADSQIRDVDVAQESAELTRLQILQQAASGVLAQANQQPQLAITLIRGV